MTTIAAPTTYTPEEVARLSDRDGKLYELVQGQLVEKPAMSTEANWIALHIGFLLKMAYPVSTAYVFTEQPTYCFDNPRAMRRPDVALVWTPRLPGGVGPEELHVVPDFVAEIVSPSNTYSGLLERVDEYLAVGVPMVWVVEPERRLVHIYRQDGSLSLLRGADTFKDEPLLPGFEARVADFFPPVPAAGASQ